MPGHLKVLYTKSEVRSAITELFSFANRRRVAITAFVGEGAGAFLPKPEGIELICWPQPGGTDPDAVRYLIASGVRVRFADGLHMKIYWAEGKGAVVTSANLSANALGAGNLREAGVLLPARTVDVDRIIGSIHPRPVSGAELHRLDKAHRRFHMGKGRIPVRTRVPTFREWYSEPSRSRWKLGCWDSEGQVSKAAKQVSTERYGVRSPHTFIACRQRQYSDYDCILTFYSRGESISNIEWMYVDFRVKVSRSDKRAYSYGYPYQAVQVWTPKHYPAPPFVASGEFRRAFRRALRKYGLSKVTGLDVTKPPPSLVQLIYREIGT